MKMKVDCSCLDSSFRIIRRRSHLYLDDPNCVKSEGIPPSSKTNVRHSSRSRFQDVKQANETKMSSILVVKTQNDSLCSYRRLSSNNLSTRNKSFDDNCTSVSRASSSSMSNVTFDMVHVREYPRCVGDNVPSSGPPIR